jgi:D-alanyl-D-alanine carboxypeptidase
MSWVRDGRPREPGDGRRSIPRSASDIVPLGMGISLRARLLPPAVVLVFAGIVCAARAAAEGPPADLAPRLDALLARSYPADEPGAAVLVEKDGQVLLRKGYGMASLELGVPIRPEMVFKIGSLTKQLTAFAILKLAQEGKLSLDDEIPRFLPGYPTHGRRITIENLLTHTSGIPNYTALPDWQKGAFHGFTPAELLDRVKDLPLDFAPGEKWLYDNSGYLLLGQILEKLTGKDYAAWLAENVFTPLGMTHTTAALDPPIVPGRVAGYEGASGHFRNALHTGGGADGGLLSSIDDLALWERALGSGKLLRRDLLDRMLTPYRLRDGRSTNYGYGWELWSYEGHRVAEHDGILNGFKSEVMRMPEDRLLIVILSNHLDHAPPPASLAIEMAALAIGRPLAERKTVPLPPAALDRYVGVYQLDAATARAVTREGDRLYSQRTGSPKLEILPAGGDEFFYRETLDRLRFQRDAQGRITGMVLDRRYGGEEVAVRTGEAPRP